MKTPSLNPTAETCRRSLPLATWQTAHRQLLQDDTQYRKRFHTYLATLICLSCVLSVFYLPFFGVRLFAPMINIALILGLAAVIVGLSVRQILFQKQSISRYFAQHGGISKNIGAEKK